jgi:hypothetical protein
MIRLAPSDPSEFYDLMEDGEYEEFVTEEEG